MENNKAILNQHIENVKGSFGSYFTPDKLKNDFGYPAAGKCYINMEYDNALELHDCILRDFY